MSGRRHTHTHTHTQTLSDVITERIARRRKTGLHVIVHKRLHVHVQAVIAQRQLFFCSVIQSVLFWLAKLKVLLVRHFTFD